MQGRQRQVAEDDRHYLEHELDSLVRDPWIRRFIRAGSLDGIWYRDLERPGQEWLSPGFWHLLGIDPGTQIHSPSAWQALINLDDLRRARANFRAHCADPAHPYDQVLRFAHADGSTLLIRCRGLAIRRPDGAPIRMLGAYHAVSTPERPACLSTADRTMASPPDDDQQIFASATPHDLKSPANTIRMLLVEARRALKDGLADEADTMLAQAQTTNEAMRSLVDRALEYTRRAGRAQAHAPVDLDHLLAEVLATLRADILDTRARVSVGRFGTVIGSDWQLRRMFQNFITNALKFQPNGRIPAVEIRPVAAAPGRRGIEIADNGIGIAPHDQPRIFDLFGRSHPTSTLSGSGIGLAFCARVAQHHGSEIAVRSEVGQGTVFSICLPKPAEAIS